MKMKRLFVAVALGASLLAFAPTGVGAEPRPPGAKGTITLEGLTLAGTQFGTPSGLPTTVATDPLAIPVTKGDTFTYSTITCASPFPPFNRVGLHFDPDYPGLADPASVRHDLRGTVISATPSGNHAVVKGTITSFLCEGGVRTDQIVSRFTAALRPTTDTSVVLKGGGPVPTTGGLELRGRFHIINGTGRFADLHGNGELTGQFTCLPRTLQRNEAQSCEQLGAFSEVPFQLQGRFKDPTVRTM
jgi:hypothetical protein